MQLNLTKPICFFDLETTGVNITNDRIVEISILKVYPDGKEERYTRLVNPTIPIPPEVTKVHGISDKDVADKPTFKELAKEIHNLIKDSDLGGFNSNRFDIPLLAEEMLRADIDFDMKNRQSIDVQTIFHKMEQRTLVAAYKFYCDKNLEDAHSAEADTLATYEVLKAQVAKYDELENNTKFLAEFSSRKKFADFAGFLIYNKEGEECFSFGKHKGKRVVDILETEPGYFGWLLNADFPLYTKKVLTSIKLRDLNNK
ncbi:DNA Pol III Epsilon Chain [Xanthomarina gelatinilytica]|uniref:DNA Pol III Epsilon Chain n=1 Tax=Xanthomarina gelatinilytica TaxID=1137281 RepID=M7NAC3_9FLAO|nr:3'-5' exonuclease [Xanthomarina gelatinilytica]EMQ95428.1 DNA Pol III Epsilon Chain [Xanthomarina gelatinilytica]